MVTCLIDENEWGFDKVAFIMCLIVCFPRYRFVEAMNTKLCKTKMENGKNPSSLTCVQFRDTRHIQNLIRTTIVSPYVFLVKPIAQARHN